MNIMGYDISGMATSGINIITLVLAILIPAAFIALGVYLYYNNKKFGEYTCVIWEQDGFGHTIESYDKAGIFIDKKTNNKRFFLKKNNVGLDPDNIPFIPTGKGKKSVYLLKHGLKNFEYIKPEISTEGLILHVGEEDVNWALNSYERAKNLFNTNTLLQYMPYIIFAFTIIIILVIFIYFFKQFPILKEVASAMKEAASSLAQARGGGVGAIVTTVT